LTWLKSNVLCQGAYRTFSAGRSWNPNKWGEFVITPALMMGMEDIILDRIAFDGVKELEEMYE
jgi:hypothetical protein